MLQEGKQTKPYSSEHINYLPPGYDPSKSGVSPFYIPNRIPLSERILNTVSAVFLLAYGTYGIYVNDLYIPGKRSKGVHLHDVPAWIMYGAFICACLVLISEVIDHYDTRNNEHVYHRFANICKYLGWGFFGLSMFAAIGISLVAASPK